MYVCVCLINTTCRKRRIKVPSYENDIFQYMVLRYFECNTTYDLWNSTQNILPIHWLACSSAFFFNHNQKKIYLSTNPTQWPSMQQFIQRTEFTLNWFVGVSDANLWCRVPLVCFLSTRATLRWVCRVFSLMKFFYLVISLNCVKLNDGSVFLTSYIILT